MPVSNSSRRLTVADATTVTIDVWVKRGSPVEDAGAVIV
jgi:hypothetical protein